MNITGIQNLTRGLWKTANGLYWVESNNPIMDFEKEIWYGVLYFNKNRRICPLNPSGEEYKSVSFEYVSDNLCWDFAKYPISSFFS